MEGSNVEELREVVDQLLPSVERVVLRPALNENSGLSVLVVDGCSPARCLAERRLVFLIHDTKMSSSPSAGFGYCGSSFSSACRTSVLTTRLRYHFRLAGTMCHGAAFVLHLVSTSWYAAWYWPHSLRSSRSPALNF